MKRMKPHIRLKYGIWVCSRKYTLAGTGVTPKSALEYWAYINNLYWRDE